MYLPAHFARPSPQDWHPLIQRHPLGTLVTYTGQGLDANHLPFLLDPAQGPLGTLRAHVARANPVWQPSQDGAEVLVIFRGAEGYISPNWYPSKHEAHRQVPTWNYTAVHAHGRLTVHDDAKFVRNVIARLTHQHEAREPRPWKMGDAPPDYLDAMVQAIVGIEITLTRLEGKAKLGQNREMRDRMGAIEALRERGQNALAEDMAQTLADTDEVQHP